MTENTPSPLGNVITRLMMSGSRATSIVWFAVAWRRR
jgi:hypothetical protein